MKSEILDFMKEQDRFTFGPFVIAWFETNPQEQPDCVLCHTSPIGPHIATLVSEAEWEKDAADPSIQLISLSNVRGNVLLLTGFKEKDQAAHVMQLAREFASSHEPESRFVN